MKFSLLPICALVFAPTLSQAELAFSPYLGAGFEHQRIDIDEADFDTSLLVLQAGAWLWPGIGFDLELGTGLADDTSNGVTAEHTQFLRYGVRLMTPPRKSNTVLYVLLSGVRSTIDLQTAGNGVPGENSFSGYHAGVGLGTQLTPQWLLDISYNDYQVDESFEIKGFRLNAQYALPRINR